MNEEWTVTLVPYWPRGQTDRPHVTFTIEGQEEPPKEVVHDGQLWCYQFVEETEDGKAAFYSYSGESP